MDDLHTRIRTALQTRLDTARAAGGVPWEASIPGAVHVSAAAIAANKHAFGHLGYVASVPIGVDREHIAANDPASVIRRTEAALRILDRHAPEVVTYAGGAVNTECQSCESLWPCPDIRDLADLAGVDHD